MSLPALVRSIPIRLGMFFVLSGLSFGCGEPTEPDSRPGLHWIVESTAEEIHSIASYGGQWFAVGPSGGIYELRDGDWRLVESGTDQILVDIWGSQEAGVFAVGTHGACVHYDGTSWSAIETGSDATLLTVWGFGTDHVLAAGEPRVLLRYDGTSWSEDRVEALRDWVVALGGTAPDDVHAVGIRGLAAHFDGSTWTRLSPGTNENLRDVWAFTGTEVYACGSAGTLLRYDADAWFGLDPPGGYEFALNGIWGRSPRDLYVAGESAVLHFDGDVWDSRPLGARPRNTASIFGDAEGTIRVAHGSSIYRLDGSDWVPELTARPVNLFDVWTISPDHSIAVGDRLVMTGLSQFWYVSHEDPTASWKAVWASGPRDIFVVGDDGRILHYDGSIWAEMSSGTTQDLMGIWGFGPAEVFAVGTVGTILRYDGAVWSLLPPVGVPGQHCTGVWGAGSDDLFVSTHRGVYRRNHEVWTQMEGSGSGLEDIHGLSASDVTAVCDAGQIYHFDGTSWSIQLAERAENLLGLWRSGPGAGYAAGVRGTLMRLVDGSWTQMDGPVDQAWFGICATSDNEVIAVGSSSRIQRYTSR
ncbi:MAG: hypothetical protein R3E12_19820 [Candidatus Eisenbacteria bacterium]